jgi:hypothetical protein
MCIANGGYEVSLTLRRVYKVIPNEKAEKRKMVQIVDDTGEAYWFSASGFVPVELSEEAESSFELVLA